VEKFNLRKLNEMEVRKEYQILRSQTRLQLEGNDLRQTEMHTAESLEPEPSAFEVEMVIEELK
jgi:hypothetical protein